MENEFGRFKRMADAIDRLAEKYDEEPFVYSVCQWGWENPVRHWYPVPCDHTDFLKVQLGTTHFTGLEN